MSKEFVQGLPRKTLVPFLPDGMVRLRWEGKLGPDGTKTFKRPIPFVQASLEQPNPMVVGKDRTCLATVEEAEYLLSLGGGFSKVVEETKPPMPELPEVEAPEVEAVEVVEVPEVEAVEVAATQAPDPVEPEPVAEKTERPRVKGKFVKKEARS